MFHVESVSELTCSFFTWCQFSTAEELPCPKKKPLTYSFALEDYRYCLVPNGLAVLNVQHSEMVDDKTYNLQTIGNNVVSKDFRWVCLLLFYYTCMSKKGFYRV